MRRRFAFTTLLAFTFLILPLTGCLSGGSWGGGTSGSSLHGKDGDSVSDVVYLTHNDRVALLLLIEGSASGGVSSGPSPSGTIVTPTGRVVSWLGKVRNGQLDELRIDDTIFPLAGGSVFYIDVRDGRTLVQQLKLDPNEIAGGNRSVRANMRASAVKHPVVMGFVERCVPSE